MRYTQKRRLYRSNSKGCVDFLAYRSIFRVAKAKTELGKPTAHLCRQPDTTVFRTNDTQPPAPHSHPGVPLRIHADIPIAYPIYIYANDTFFPPTSPVFPWPLSVSASALTPCSTCASSWSHILAASGSAHDGANGFLRQTIQHSRLELVAMGRLTGSNLRRG
jgi:hypothetical protein